jgi:hypothetical protein
MGSKRVAEGAASIKKLAKKTKRNSFDNRDDFAIENDNGKTVLDVAENPNVASRLTNYASTLATRPAAAHDNKMETMKSITADPSEDKIAPGGT